MYKPHTKIISLKHGIEGIIIEAHRPALYKIRVLKSDGRLSIGAVICMVRQDIERI